jgi:iduronate 2-sulfatase
MKVLSLVAGLIAVATLGTATAAEPKPNILFIAVDDLRPQMGCYGQAWMKTPQMDRLAAEGMRFDRHYVQFAVCIPSRAALLTSLRSERTHQTYAALIWQNTPGAVGVGRWFSQQGFRTVSLGKVWHTPDGKNADKFDEADMVKGSDYVLPENVGLSGSGSGPRHADPRPGVLSLYRYPAG